MITINNKFPIGETVYLKTDREQLQRLIIGVEIYPDKSYVYKLSCGQEAGYHFELEISREAVIYANQNS